MSYLLQMKHDQGIEKAHKAQQKATKELADVDELEARIVRCECTLAKATERQDRTMMKKASDKLAGLHEQYGTEWREVQSTAHQSLQTVACR